MTFKELPFEDRLRFIEFHDRELSIERELNRQCEIKTKLQRELQLYTDEDFDKIYNSYINDLNIRLGRRIK